MVIIDFNFFRCKRINNYNFHQEIERNRHLKKIPDIDMDLEDDALKEIRKFVKGYINFVQFVSFWTL